MKNKAQNHLYLLGLDTTVTLIMVVWKCCTANVLLAI